MILCIYTDSHHTVRISYQLMPVIPVKALSDFKKREHQTLYNLHVILMFIKSLLLFKNLNRKCCIENDEKYVIITAETATL